MSIRVPWTTLPKAAGFQLYDWEAGLHAMFWVVLEKDGEWAAGLEDIHSDIQRRLAGLARGGSSGSGAWEEGKPWARLARTQTYSMAKFERPVGIEVHLEDWEIAKQALRDALAIGKPGAAVIEQESSGRMGDPPLFGDESCKRAGLAMLALDEAAELAVVAAESSVDSRMSLAL